MANEEIVLEVVSKAENIYMFPHLEKTGGTSLSFVLAMAGQVVCGSAASAGWCWKQMCHRDACMFNQSKAWHENMVEFTSDQHQRTRLAHVQRLAHHHGHTASNKVQTAFAHERPEVLRAMFPKGKMLLLFRSPDAHRVSFFSAMRSERWASETNFSTWIRGDSYVHVRGMQLKWAHNALYADKALDSAAEPPPAKNTALALLEGRDIAWVGLLEQWDSSMCMLSRALGLQSQFYSFARNMHTRWYTKDDPLNALRLASGVTPEDYSRLLALEANEWQFVSLLSREISNRIAAEGPCACDTVNTMPASEALPAERHKDAM